MIELNFREELEEQRDVDFVHTCCGILEVDASAGMKGRWVAENP